MTVEPSWADLAGETPAGAPALPPELLQVAELVRGYDAAQVGRRTDGWYAGGGSANAEIGRAAGRVSWRARDLVRNNPYAAAGVRKLAAKIVGAGIMPRIRGSKTERDEFRDDWERFCDTSDPSGHIEFNGQAAQGTRAVISDGESLFRTRWRTARQRRGNKHPLMVEVLETDWLDRSKTERPAAGGAIVQGVEFNADAERVGYWLFDEHPGEPLGVTGMGGGLASKRADADTIHHVFDPLRPGQARGVSWFAPVVIKARDIGDADDARVVLWKIASCMAGFVTRENGPARTTLLPGANGKVSTDAKGRPIERFAPGMITYLDGGEDVKFSNPPSAEGYLDFMYVQLHAIAAGLGTTYQQLTGDLKGVNFSSIREGKLDFWDLLDCWQWLMVIPQLIKPIARKVRLARLAGWRPDPLWTGYTFGVPRRQWVDPVKDLAAARDEVRSGMRSLRDVVAERGEDLDDVLDEIAEDNARIDALGLILETDPRRTSRAGGAPAAQPDGDGNDETGEGAGGTKTETTDA